MVDYINIIGFSGGVLTTFAAIPQLIKSWKTKSTKDISSLFLLILLVGIALWFIYGLLLDSMPIIMGNGAAFILYIIILTLKLRYK